MAAFLKQQIDRQIEESGDSLVTRLRAAEVEGEKVVMWYTSASRDEEGAEDPQRFDIHSLTAMPVRFTPGAREAG